MSVRVKIGLRHVVDRDGIIHKFIWNETANSPAMMMARCYKVVASRAKYLRFADGPPTCILCIDDTWEPS